MRSLRLLSLISVVALVAVFVGRTGPDLLRDLGRGRLLPFSPDASMDALLEPLLRVSHPSVRLAAMFERIPEHGAILFVSRRGDDRWDFVYSAVCYLAWPRRIERDELGPGESARRERAGIDLIIFCGDVETVVDSQTASLGPNLRMQMTAPAP